MLFDKVEDLIDYLAVSYPKSRGKTLASWQTSGLSMAVGVYEGEDLIQGLIIYKDPKRDYKWVLLDSLHADLATRNYIEFVSEFAEAIELFDEIEEISHNWSENDECFFEDLD
jgi:hypothetical protein